LLEMEPDLRQILYVFEPKVEVLKNNNIFCVTLPDGSIWDGEGEPLSFLGLYCDDTRYLSRLGIFIDGWRPVYLSSSVRGSHFAQIELTNPPFLLPEGRLIPAQTLHLRILRLINKGALYQRFRLINFNLFPVKINLTIVVGADYRDIFEVKGCQRRERGQLLDTEVHPQSCTLAYRGLDGILRTTHIQFEPFPQGISGQPGRAEAVYRLLLPPQKKIYLHLKVEPNGYHTNSNIPLGDLFPRATLELARLYRQWQKECTQIITDNNFINHMVTTATTDLKSLELDYPGEGKILAAGIPWYTAPFGRDALITSWQTLILNTNIAKDALLFLAHHQGKKVDAWREERPGKIFHELRRGEMANCGEIPHSPYYGSVDATLWFIILIGHIYRWTRDEEFLKAIFPNLERALNWCFSYGDVDGDGYIEYHKESPAGLSNQGWKDSWDGILHRDGTLPQGPIALVEVQAYFYQALLEAAYLYRILGREEPARELETRAQRLKDKFNRDFWMEEEGYLLLGLDGEKRPIATLASNGGHALFTGILEPERARRVARRLLSPEFYSGWGIRTLGKYEKSYNPMSYHNGSVWPHDNSIIAAGLRRYHCLEELVKLSQGMFAASSYFDYRRWPELFCGFTRRGLSGPVRYPVACDPQAWTVGALFALITSLLGISVREEVLFIESPLLIPGTKRIEIKNLRIARTSLDLAFEQRGNRVFTHVLRKEGDLRIIIEA